MAKIVTIRLNDKEEKEINKQRGNQSISGWIKARLFSGKNVLHLKNNIKNVLHSSKNVLQNNEKQGSADISLKDKNGRSLTATELFT